MSIGSASVDAGYLILGGIAALFVIPLVLWLVGQVGRLVAWIFRTKSSYFTAAWWAIWIAVLLVGGSIYLDQGAARITGTVSEKTESVELQREGGWKSNFRTTFAYSFAGETGQVVLGLGEADFDALPKGASAELEIAPLYHTIAIVRLATINTWQWLATPLRWLALIAAGAFLIWWAYKRKSRWLWIAIGVVAFLLAITIPTYITYHAWQSAEDLASRPLRGEATVTAVDQITNIDYFPCEGNCSDTADTSFDVPQKYQIIQMSYVPPGHTEAVLAADSADSGSLVTFVGDTLPIAYAEANPRNVQIIGVTHSHYWRNAIFFVATTVMITLFFFVAQVAFHWFVEFVGQKLRGRASE